MWSTLESNWKHVVKKVYIMSKIEIKNFPTILDKLTIKENFWDACVESKQSMLN